MKKKWIFLTTSILTISTALFVPVDFHDAEATTLPTNISLMDNDEESVRSYYSSIEKGKTGSALLADFKAVLSTNQLTYSYAQVSNIYKITDRDWVMSDEQSADFTSYSYSNDDPYIYCLYRDDNHTATASKMSVNSESEAIYQIDKEHCWAKSIGNFSTNAPAGTDLHHLIAADHVNNSSGHGNYCYGEPTDNVQIIGDQAHNKTGKLGTITYHNEKIYLYEPQDQDKGDIARALMYMATRYSSYTSQYDPYLQLVDYPTSNSTTTSSETTPAVQGIISTLLKWHQLDPVDDYEIHRNNLIYNNYQKNRNPFIDFPNLARIIFDDTYTTTFNYETEKVALVGQSDLEIESIEVNHLKTAYQEGEAISLNDNGNVKLTYTNGDVEYTNLNDSNIEISLEGNQYVKGTSLTISDNDKSVIISYSLNGVKVSSNEINIQVSEYISKPVYYQKVEENLTNYEGNYLVVYSKDEDNLYTLNSSLETLDSANNYVSVNRNNDWIIADSVSTSNALIVEAYQEGYAIKTSNGKYLGNTSTGNALSASETPLLLNLNYTEDYFEIIEQNRNTRLGFNFATNQNRFRFYSQSSSYSKNLVLYKEVTYQDLLIQWANTYLHMDYTSNEGLCKNYYPLAKKALNELNNTYSFSKEELVNNPVLSQYKTRYEAWAILNQDDPYNGASSTSNLIHYQQDNDTSSIIIVSVVLTLSSLLSIGCYIKKRKWN